MDNKTPIICAAIICAGMILSSMIDSWGYIKSSELECYSNSDDAGLTFGSQHLIPSARL